MTSMKHYWLAKGLKIMSFVVVMGSLMGVVVMLMWNWLMPSIFGWGTITWIQALGLMLLSRFLFGTWGAGPYRGSKDGGGQWRKKWAQKWDSMSPEERNKFKEKFRHHRGCGPQHPSSSAGTVHEKQSHSTSEGDPLAPEPEDLEGE